MTIEQILHQLHREESGKIIAVLTKIFGASNLQLAEDVVQDAFIEAIENWGKNMPENPKGWIYQVAKNKAVNVVNRKKYEKEYQSEVTHLLTSDWTVQGAIDQLFSEEEIQDDQLKMMFTCCDNSISIDSQTALILKTLCGFGIPEIAKAYLVSEETINKRLVRARKKIRANQSAFKIPEEKEINERLTSVLKAIYLLFNEGYSASSGDKIIRYELCLESIRLTQLLIESSLIKSKGEAHSLMALMSLNASRFIARLSESGEIITMENQDRNLWDATLIQQGILHLNAALEHKAVNGYLILAAISANHSTAVTFEATDWNQILSLYDQLLSIDDSPVVQLNRAVAVSMVNGPEKAIQLLEYLKGEKSLETYHHLYSALGDLYQQTGQVDQAIQEYQIAISHTEISTEKEWIQGKIKKCH